MEIKSSCLSAIGLTKWELSTEQILIKMPPQVQMLSSACPFLFYLESHCVEEKVTPCAAPDRPAGC